MRWIELLTMAFAAVVAIMAVAAVACSEPLEFPDWTIAVPAGTTIIEYAEVPPEERTRRFELVEDLVIGERGHDLDYVFGRLPPSVAVDATGNIYVLDPSNHHVQAFDATGEFRFSFGREGEAPGEFGQPQQIAVAGETIVVFDGPAMRLSRWSLDGEHLDDADVVPPRRLASLAGNPDGTVVARHRLASEGPGEPRRAAFTRLDAQRGQLVEFARVDSPSPIRYPPAGSGETGGIGMFLFVGVTQPDFGLAPGNSVYVSNFDEYQVLALDLEGEPRWALRVAAPRPPLSDTQIQTWMDRLRSRYPDARVSEIDWPEFAYALDALKVDGQGHLYVLPTGDDARGSDTRVQDRPVDVYSANGARLAGGRIGVGSLDRVWQAALDDHVYGVTQDEAGEWQVVRHRLVEPF